MRSWWKRFVVHPIMQTLDEISWFGFLLSAILVAAIVNIVTSILLAAIGSVWAVVVLLIVLAATVGFANLYMMMLRAAEKRGQLAILDKRSPTPRRGLIVMVTRAPTLRKAIDYHAGSAERPGKLEHVWLIVTPEMADQAKQLRAHAESRGVRCHELDLADEYDANGCYQLVRDVFQVHAQAHKLVPAEIIADITGGTKPMTAGMLLACDDLKQALEHVPTRFDLGQPSVPLDPIEIVLTRTNSGANKHH